MKSTLTFLTALLLAPLAALHAADAAPDRSTFFDVPGFAELPPAVEVVSETTDAGVKVTELYFAGAPFNGQPTKIYGFYCRPEKDGFFAMPGVLATYRAIPTEKRLLMFPNENHGYVGNVSIPLSWFKTVLGMAPVWPTVAAPTTKTEGDKAKLSVSVIGPTKTAKVSFWVKRMPKAIFRWGRGDKAKQETQVKWIEVPAAAAGDSWTAEIPAPGADEQVVAYATATDESGVQDSSDTIELPDYPQWRGVSAFKPSEQKSKAVAAEPAPAAANGETTRTARARHRRHVRS